MVKENSLKEIMVKRKLQGYHIKILKNGVCNMTNIRTFAFLQSSSPWNMEQNINWKTLQIL